jgi:hypothetical protein
VVNFSLIKMGFTFKRLQPRLFQNVVISTSLVSFSRGELQAQAAAAACPSLSGSGKGKNVICAQNAHTTFDIPRLILDTVTRT